MLETGYYPPPMDVLGIETSCDETGVALYRSGSDLLAHALHSQVDVHAVYGGVVPEIASRDHIRMLLPLIRAVLREANVEQPGAIAYTAGPGLVGALMVGGGMANGLGLAWNCPSCSSSWRPKTRSSKKAPIHCRRLKWIAF